MNLQLPLKKQWFEMTKAGIKTEDYREITPYWCNRFLVLSNGKKLSKKYWSLNGTTKFPNMAPDQLSL